MCFGDVTKGTFNGWITFFLLDRGSAVTSGELFKLPQHYFFHLQMQRDVMGVAGGQCLNSKSFTGVCCGSNA